VPSLVSCPINPEALGSAFSVASSSSSFIWECGTIRDKRPTPGIASDEGSAVTVIFQTFEGKWKTNFLRSRRGVVGVGDLLLLVVLGAAETTATERSRTAVIENCIVK
jgi:hypothetical protein